MSSSPVPDPRVRVTLPGGATVEARLLRRAQQEDGAWLYEVQMPVPAAAVAPIPGEDYGGVPTDRAGWLLQRLPGETAGDRPRLMLHEASCWMASGKLTPATGKQARIHVREGWAEPCDACEPAP